MRIIIYTKHARNVSGITTFERAFMQAFCKEHAITYLYDMGDPEILREFEQYASVIRNVGQIVRGDIAIFSTVFTQTPALDVRKRIQVIHTNLEAFGARLKNQNIDAYVSVSPSVQALFKKSSGNDSIVIHNLLPEIKTQNVLRLMTASRIAEGKGFDNIVELVKRLKAHGRPFVYEIYGDGAFTFIDKYKQIFSKYPEVHFMGNKDWIQSYMLRNDFIVQLSPHEGFCYSIHEALQIGKPVIVTEWEGVRDTVEDGVNGFVLKHDLSNLDIEKLYNFEDTFVKFPEIDYYNVNNIKQWNDLFN